MIVVQQVDYIRIPVTDMEKANEFYGEVLGLERNPNSPGEDWLTRLRLPALLGGARPRGGGSRRLKDPTFARPPPAPDPLPPRENR